MALVTCPCAFRLRRLAQNVHLTSGTWHVSSKFACWRSHLHVVSAGPDAAGVRVRSGSTLRSLPESSLIGCTCSEGQEISKAPKKGKNKKRRKNHDYDEKTNKKWRIWSTFVQINSRAQERLWAARSVSIVNSRPASPHCFCLCFSLDSYFSVQHIVGHQSFFVGAPNPAAWGGAGTLRVLGDSASNLGIPLATAPRFGQRNLLMLSGATLAALLRSGRTILWAALAALLSYWPGLRTVMWLLLQQCLDAIFFGACLVFTSLPVSPCYIWGVRDANDVGAPAYVKNSFPGRMFYAHSKVRGIVDA